MSHDETAERLDALEAEMETIKKEIRLLHRELRVQGIEVPELEGNPAKLPMSAQGLRELRKQLAARARAAKPVGRGQGAVLTPKTKRRLEKQAREVTKKK